MLCNKEKLNDVYTQKFVKNIPMTDLPDSYATKYQGFGIFIDQHLKSERTQTSGVPKYFKAGGCWVISIPPTASL